MYQLRWGTGVLGQNTPALKYLMDSTDALVEASLLVVALMPLYGSILARDSTDTFYGSILASGGTDTSLWKYPCSG